MIRVNFGVTKLHWIKIHTHEIAVPDDVLYAVNSKII